MDGFAYLASPDGSHGLGWTGLNPASVLTVQHIGTVHCCKYDGTDAVSSVEKYRLFCSIQGSLRSDPGWEKGNRMRQG